MSQIHPLDRPGVRSEIVAGLGVSQQVITHWKVRGVPIEHCVDIDRATNGVIRRWDLRPDDWHRIWPELISAEGAPAVPSEQAA